jgi:nitrogen regulatory protein P-II 1
MKKVEAIISPHRLDEVKEALIGGGIEAMTASEVRTFDGHSCHVELYRGTRYAIDFHPRIRIELALTDDQALTAVGVLERVVRTGKADDETVLVMPIEDVVKIRTGEHGTAAVRSTGHVISNAPAPSRPHSSPASVTA